MLIRALILRLRPHDEAMTMEFKSFRFKADNVTEDGVFTGYANTFNEKDLGGDIVIPGAFDQWLSLWKSGQVATPPILDNHDSTKVLGLYLDFTPDEKGLHVKGQLNQETVAGKEKRALMKQGALTGLSIGYGIYPGGIQYDAKQDAYLLTNLELWEVSIATFPMNTSSRIDTVKSAFLRDGRPTIRDIERTLRENGFSGNMAKAIAKISNERLELAQLDQHRDGAADEEAKQIELAKSLQTIVRKHR